MEWHGQVGTRKPLYAINSAQIVVFPNWRVWEGLPPIAYVWFGGKNEGKILWTSSMCKITYVARL